MWKKFRQVIKNFYFFMGYLARFIATAFSSRGLVSPTGRILIWGKIRRMILGSIPPLALYLRKSHGLRGGCTQCGASCQILFQCPQYDTKSGKCNVYENRPWICQNFPITPADIRDRNLVLKDTPLWLCLWKALTGYWKTPKRKRTRRLPRLSHTEINPTLPDLG